MYITKDIESPFELPYTLIDIRSGAERFVLEFTEFDEGQSDYSIQAGGVTGKFGIRYNGLGMDAKFECDITMGNLAEFNYSLDTSWDIYFGRDSSAVLCDYTEPHRTLLEFKFDSKGKCYAKGNFLNKTNSYCSGVNFEMDVDPSFIPEIIGTINIFFDELKHIQEHDTFY